MAELTLMLVYEPYHIVFRGDCWICKQIVASAKARQRDLTRHADCATVWSNILSKVCRLNDHPTTNQRLPVSILQPSLL